MSEVMWGLSVVGSITLGAGGGMFTLVDAGVNVTLGDAGGLFFAVMEVGLFGLQAAGEQ